MGVLFLFGESSANIGFWGSPTDKNARMKDW
jgi:hypothetical protein